MKIRGAQSKRFMKEHLDEKNKTNVAQNVIVEIRLLSAALRVNLVCFEQAWESALEEENCGWVQIMD